MALILHIDTAQEEAGIALSENDQILHILYNKEQKNHAAFIQPAIQEMIQNSEFRIQNLNAVSVIAGPGSYTGLRIGLASAKGLCYALNIPLIMINTLEMMAQAVINLLANQLNQPTLFCPMIDARRDEVFTAIYDSQLNILMEPSALILNKNSFSRFLESHKVVFFGSGSEKWNVICENHNMIYYSNMISTIKSQVQLSYEKYINQNFVDIYYSEPYYIKNFYTST